MEVVLRLDREVLSWLQAHRSGGLDSAMRLLTHLGDRWVLIPMVVLVALGLLVSRFRSEPRPNPQASLFSRLRDVRVWREPLAVIAAGLLSTALTEVVKPAVARERPPQVASPVVSRLESWSFPSGHALSSSAVYGVVALLGASRLRHAWQRRLLVVAAVLLSGVVGLTRLYLGVHYFSDVAAGWCAGWALAIVFAEWARRGEPESYRFAHR